MSSDTAITLTFHHFNLKATHPLALIGWYPGVVDPEVIFQGGSPIELPARERA